MKKKKPLLEHVKDKDYREIYVTGAFGGFDSHGGFHIIFYSPTTKPESIGEKNPVVQVNHKVKVIMTPSTLKHLIMWLTKSLAEYESKFGEPQDFQPQKQVKIVGTHPPEKMYG